MRALFAGGIICLLIAGAGMSAPASDSRTEKKKYEGILIRASDEPSKISLDEILAAVKYALKPENEDSLFAALMAFDAICRKAEKRRLPELVKIFRMVPADAPDKGNFFTPLGQAWLRFKVPEKQAKLPKFPEVTEDQALPKGAPPEVWRYLSVLEPMRRFSGDLSPEGGREVPPHEAEYWKLVESLLDSGKGPFSRKLVKYHYGGGCMGGEAFTIPQATALAMAFVADGKWAEAAGTALSVEGTDVGGSIRLLRASVENPLEAVLGGLAYKQARPYSGTLTSLLAVLLGLPGDGRAEGLIAQAERAEDRDQAEYFRALAMLALALPGDGSEAGRYSVPGWEGLKGAPVVPLDKEGREKVKAFLCSRDVNHLSIDGAEELVRILADSKWPEAKPALRGLLAHPSLTVAEGAAKRLQEAGETVQMPPKLGPVRYRLLVDGKPYAERPVAWSLYRGEFSKQGQVKSNADGVVEIPRDPFLESTSAADPRFGLHSLEMADAAAPWFGVQLPLPPANENVIPVEVKTVPVRVVLPEVRPEAELAGKFTKLTMRPVSWPGHLGPGFYSAAEVRTPAGREFILNLAPGEYRAEVRMPGASNWAGKIDAVKNAELELPLTRASMVSYAFSVPKGWTEGTGAPTLMQDGKAVSLDYETEPNVIRGLKEGKYVLHFPSSAELRERHDYWKKQTAPDFKGVDVAFEVNADSPAEIDLGEIVLK